MSFARGLATTLRAAAIVFPLTACSGSDEPQDGAEEEAGFGALALQLDLADYAFSDIEYTITHGGVSTRTGTLVVDRGARALRAVIGALPAFDGYLIRLKASAKDPEGSPFSCESSGLFTIRGGEASVVTIPIVCKAGATGGSEQPSEVADASIPGDACPMILAIRAVPSETSVGEIVQLHVDVEPSDPTRFSFAWTSDLGEFTSITSARAGFRCTGPGIATVDLRITSRTSPSCAEETAFVYVTCREADGV